MEYQNWQNYLLYEPGFNKERKFSKITIKHYLLSLNFRETYSMEGLISSLWKLFQTVIFTQGWIYSARLFTLDISYHYSLLHSKRSERSKDAALWYEQFLFLHVFE